MSKKPRSRTTRPPSRAQRGRGSSPKKKTRRAEPRDLLADIVDRLVKRDYQVNLNRKKTRVDTSISRYNDAHDEYTVILREEVPLEMSIDVFNQFEKVLRPYYRRRSQLKIWAMITEETDEGEEEIDTRWFSLTYVDKFEGAFGQKVSALRDWRKHSEGPSSRATYARGFQVTTQTPKTIEKELVDAKSKRESRERAKKRSKRVVPRSKVRKSSQREYQRTRGGRFARNKAQRSPRGHAKGTRRGTRRTSRRRTGKRGRK